MTGAKFTPVHYRGAAPAITDVLGGHIQMMIVSIGLVRQTWRPASSRCSASAAPRGWRNFPMCRRSPKAAARLRGGLVVRPRRAQGHAARDRRQAQRRDAEDFRRSGVPRKVPGAGMTFSIASSPEKFAARIRRRPRQMGQGHQGRRSARWSERCTSSLLLTVASPARPDRPRRPARPRLRRRGRRKRAAASARPCGRRVRNVSRISPSSYERCTAISVSSG